MSGLVDETEQLDVCTSITSCGVYNSPYFPFPSFGAVHVVATPSSLVILI